MPKGLMNEKGLVRFGDELNEKALNALQRNSPTADAILSIFSQEDFDRAKLERQALEEKIKKELKIDEKDVLQNKEIQKKVSRRELKKQELENVNLNVNLNVKKDNYLNVLNDTFFLVSFDKLKEVPNLNLSNHIEKTKYLYKDTEEELLAFFKKCINLKKPIIKLLNERKELTMNLDDELESLANETYQQTATPEQVMKSQIFDLLSKKVDAPNENQINFWKQEYGKSGVHVMAFGEDDVYIYHHLTRKQWKTIKDIMGKVEGKEADEVEEKLKEKVCLGCVLYPKLPENWTENVKAGVVDSLYQMILLNSAFLTPQQAMLLTTQL